MRVMAMACQTGDLIRPSDDGRNAVLGSGTDHSAHESHGEGRIGPNARSPAPNRAIALNAAGASGGAAYIAMSEEATGSSK